MLKARCSSTGRHPESCVKKEDALVNLTAFQAKYRQRYPEAIRSLIEDEEHLLTFYAFPQVMHRSIRSTNAIESLFSNVRQRTDQIDAFTRRYELPDHCVGGDAGYSPAQDSRRLIAEAGEVEANQQPAGKAGSGGGVFVRFSLCQLTSPRLAVVTRWESGAGFCCVLRA